MDDVQPVAVAVTLPACGPMSMTDWMGAPVVASRVQYRAHLGAGPLVVAVTASSEGFQNESWFDPRHFVAPGLNREPVPGWVPEAPEWFWEAVAEMARDVDLAAARAS